MRRPIYNSGIPEIILKPVKRAFSRAFCFRCGFVTAVLLWPVFSLAADWSTAEQQLAQKIAAVTGPGTVALTVENRSSLGRRDADIAQNGLRSALQQEGIHFAGADQAVASVTLSLSENETAYVWVAEIHQGTAEPAVVMVSVPRTGRLTAPHDSMPIVLRKTLLWSQGDHILDVAVLEEKSTPTRIAVLGPENLSTYQLQNGKWQLEQAAQISHAKPWPLDLRGRLYVAADHTLNAYLPGVICRVNPQAAFWTMNCRASDDPWPIVPGLMNTTATVFPSASVGS